MKTRIAAGSMAHLMLVVLTAPAAAQDSCLPGGWLNNLEPPTARHIRVLADDRLEGREVGTRGARCAADYIATEFEAMGLEPAGTGNSFFQGFPIRKGAGLEGRNELRVEGAAVELGRAWIPLGYSASAELDHPLVYGGYGISRPGDPDDRYAHLDLDGKIIVVEDGDPNGRGSVLGDPHFKATVAAGRGAAGILILSRPGAALPTLDDESRQILRVPAAMIAPHEADRVRSAAEAGGQATLAVGVSPTQVEARNVVAMIPGSGARDEVIVIGAHYDHLGFGGESSLASGDRSVHNGADDNASGTAGLLEIARSLAEGPALDRTVLFIAFTGEERGLWGSAHFVANPTVSLDGAVAMLNLDMVGRMASGRLTVFGVGTAEEWVTLVGEANEELAPPLTLATVPGGRGASDHASFSRAGIPVLHFYTGSHADYHRPTDDWPTINVEGVERVVDITTRIVRRLGDASVTLTPTPAG